MYSVRRYGTEYPTRLYGVTESSADYYIHTLISNYYLSIRGIYIIIVL